MDRTLISCNCLVFGLSSGLVVTVYRGHFLYGDEVHLRFYPVVRKIILYDDKVNFNFANRREEVHMASDNSVALLLNFIFKKVSVLKGKKVPKTMYFRQISSTPFRLS